MSDVEKMSVVELKIDVSGCIGGHGECGLSCRSALAELARRASLSSPDQQAVAVALWGIPRREQYTMVAEWIVKELGWQEVANDVRDVWNSNAEHGDGIDP